MHVIKVRNVHEALPEALRYLFASGIERDSRNGKVLVSPEPVATVYTHPRERVLFWPERDANPFFHFYESLWMLAGRNDVPALTRFVSRMSSFSDDGSIFHGAYGHRWRRHWAHDQLIFISNQLRENPEDRRQVLQMFDPGVDHSPHQANMKDIPCNLTVTFQVDSLGALDMVVFNRSNDIVWGAYGANAVHFSFLHEWMARAVGIEVGTCTQVSVNWHGYLDTVEPLRGLSEAAADPPYTRLGSPYDAPEMSPYPLVTTYRGDWDSDLQMFMSQEGRAVGYRDRFFRRVAVPMMATHDAFKTGKGRARYEAAWDAATAIEALDWRMAVEEWIGRRCAKWEAKHEQRD